MDGSLNVDEMKMRKNMVINGVIRFSDGGVKYVGELRGLVPHGRGVGYWENGYKWYELVFISGKPKGVGRYYYLDGVLRYEGETEGLQYVGKGIEYYKNGYEKFKGIFRKTPYFFYGARLYEKGRLYYEDGSLKYCGTFDGMKSSVLKDGIEYLKDGRVRLHGKQSYFLR